MKSIIFLFLITLTCYPQVNIEQYRDFTEKGVLKKNYNEVVNLHAAIRQSTSSLYSVGIQYFRPFSIQSKIDGFFISKLHYGKSDGGEFLNDSFYHLRFVGKKDMKSFKPELFMQSENNQFASTISRQLVGLGLRYKISDFLVSGSSILNEWYKEKSNTNEISNWRFSQYFIFKYNINERNNINTTLYIQPRIDDLNNIRYFSETTFTSEINENISYDSTLTAKFFNQSSDFNEIELFFNSGLSLKL